MAIKATASFSLKDALFNPDSVRRLSRGIAQGLPAFSAKAFEQEVLQKFPELELKARINWMVTVLGAHLPADFAAAAAILEAALPTPLDPEQADDDFGEFIWCVPAEYIARHGCTAEHLAVSLPFLRESTKRFSAENAIRPFLKHYPQATLEFVHRCAVDRNYHVRRLASEGIRPFLPWAERVNLPIEHILPVLDRLFADKTRFVTRSVANTMNDISKIDSAGTVQVLQQWRLQQPSPETEWVIRHALRTLVKKDHAGALELLGYPLQPAFRLSAIEVPAVARVGESIAYGCELHSDATQVLRVALRVYYQKANGTLAPRVFAVKDLQAAKGQTIAINKSISFKPITTRSLYPGKHQVELVVNGVARGRKDFVLQI
jgi:3-methyladenine DNA glycosylase AlkC